MVGAMEIKRRYRNTVALLLVLFLAQSFAFASLSVLGSRVVVVRHVNRQVHQTKNDDNNEDHETIFPSIQRQRTPRVTKRRIFALNPLWSSIWKTSESSSSVWLLTLRNIANWASLLCVLDCTILPLITIMLPLMGWMGPATLQHTLCVWSHGLALYLVLPLGTTTTLLNYATGHRNKGVAYLGIAGIVLVGLANGEIWELLHHGTWHRVVNLLGCALLLRSNFRAQQLGCDCGIPFCKPKKQPATPPPSALMMQTRMIQYRHTKSLSLDQITPRDQE